MKTPEGLTKANGEPVKGEITLHGTNGEQLMEFFSKSTENQHQSCCYVLTSPNDVITVYYQFEPGMVDFIDLVVDGILRDSRSPSNPSKLFKGKISKVCDEGRLVNKGAIRKIGLQMAKMQVQLRNTNTDIVIREGEGQLSEVGSIELQLFQKRKSEGDDLTDSTAFRTPNFVDFPTWADLNNHISGENIPCLDIGFTEATKSGRPQKERVTKTWPAEYKRICSMKFLLRTSAELKILGYDGFKSTFSKMGSASLKQTVSTTSKTSDNTVPVIRGLRNAPALSDWDQRSINSSSRTSSFTPDKPNLIQLPTYNFKDRVVERQVSQPPEHVGQFTFDFNATRYASSDSGLDTLGDIIPKRYEAQISGKLDLESLPNRYPDVVKDYFRRTFDAEHLFDDISRSQIEDKLRIIAPYPDHDLIHKTNWGNMLLPQEIIRQERENDTQKTLPALLQSKTETAMNNAKPSKSKAKAQTEKIERAHKETHSTSSNADKLQLLTTKRRSESSNDRPCKTSIPPSIRQTEIQAEKARIRLLNAEKTKSDLQAKYEAALEIQKEQERIKKQIREAEKIEHENADLEAKIAAIYGSLD